MNILRLFGIGSDSILDKGHSVPGKVTNIQQCWWLKVNTKPVRRFSGDGAVFPHIITFDYPVDGTPYIGKLYIPIRCRVPQKGENIQVFYDPEKPKNYACYAFGPGITL